MGLRVDRRVGLAEQIGDEGAGQQAREKKN